MAAIRSAVSFLGTPPALPSRTPCSTEHADGSASYCPRLSAWRSSNAMCHSPFALSRRSFRAYSSTSFNVARERRCRCRPAPAAASRMSLAASIRVRSPLPLQSCIHQDFRSIGSGVDGEVRERELKLLRFVIGGDHAMHLARNLGHGSSKFHSRFALHGHDIGQKGIRQRKARRFVSIRATQAPIARWKQTLLSTNSAL